MVIELRRKKRRAVHFVQCVLLAAVLAVSCVDQSRSTVQEAGSAKARQGTAILITGAAARIPQEAALLEALDSRGLLKNVVFIAGVSSGALNSVMLNGILSGKISWDEYKTILFGIVNNDIFIQHGKKIPVDTSPARKLYTGIVEGTLGYVTIGDLPFVTAISITRLKDLGLKDTVYRMFSRKINSESDTSLSLVDILMASTAIPVVFPPVHIRNAKTIPDVDYVDGGVKEDNVPYRALLEFENARGYGVENIYIVSKKNNDAPSISEELKTLGIDDHRVFDDLGLSFDRMMNKKFEESLEEYAVDSPELAARTYVFRPDFARDFLMFSFDDLKSQYALTSQWAQSNDPMPLEAFLSAHLKTTGVK
ncbi:MAG TPA: patatin-like phospholipase family protein [bacterium]|nr:patatin-like phospholipase family protein [bacterium]